MTTDTQTESLTRRDFLKMGLGALSGLAVLEVAGASLFFMQPRHLEGEFGAVVNAGPVESFPVGSVTEFPDGRFYLIHLSDGFLALSNRCTHLGCAVNWQANSQQFFCPCHASSFDMQGDVQNPPAPRALDTFAIEIIDGQVFVNTGRAQQRDHFTPEQMVD
ncbi:MAG TPA: Rieske 2Fe-2S domain-containing protein [Chloroflexota bacterium]|nr:Rieske 2Fe-2S domain-containing protein [Chloroflexota bacterium]